MLKEQLRFFGFSLAVTVATMLAVHFRLGWSATLVLALLILIEITFSFENAVINAKVLRSMSRVWQTIFLTIGIVVAIFGMRVVFPILVVVLTAHLPWQEVLQLALNDPAQYAHKLELAHPLISSFGGAFLLMLFLSFFFDRNKEAHWIEVIERPLHRIGNHWLPAVFSALVVTIIALLPNNHHAAETFKAGLLGVVVYAAIRLIEHVFSRFKSDPSTDDTKIMHQTGWAAFATFVYLEILDASFSFDGVIGAFAITQSVILIAAGLGVGAVWVRSMTVYMVRKGTLEKYLYLEHGAHYTVGVLAATLLLSVVFEVPEIVAGLAGVVFVGSAFWSSRRHIKRTAAK